MEEETLVKPSVAELAGMFKCHDLPKPTGIEGGKPVRRKPPCSLKLHDRKDGGEGKEEKCPIISPHPPKVKPKNSPLIEKLQANLALSPTGPQLSPKSPGVKLTSPFSPNAPFSPLSPMLRPPQRQLSEEAPASFENPAEGSVLPSINKCRPRLSIKRRPPTRKHRTSCGEESGASGEAEGSQQNGDEEDVFLERSKDALEAQETTAASSDPNSVGAAAAGTDDSGKVEEGKAELLDRAPGDAAEEPEKEAHVTVEEVKEPREEAPGRAQDSESSLEALEESEAQTKATPEPDRAEERKEEEEEEKGETQAPEEMEQEEENYREVEKQEELESTAD
ncbi:hypothetical protein SKAU_G00271380 [Synaphobranchus kaupii]|uniref:FAM21/CAPZIP domain-containing protein n=1 Tax=Synaphobranchus kaupii TaxID=118154 RepID=A0A9Q1F097_SYNKA|nr:hypothetical protein SKAU_G00271380 [Synaphobranchus kaupii]